MIKWCTHTEGVLPYVAHAVVYHHLWCGPAVASHQKSHAPVVCLGPRWWFYSSSTIFWLILDMGRDGMEALLHVGWQSPVAASNGNDIIGRGCTGEFSCAKARNNSGSTCARKKKSKITSQKNNSRHPQNWWFLLSAMVANIHLWALFCEQFVPPPNRWFPLLTMAAYIHLWVLFCEVNITSSWL